MSDLPKVSVVMPVYNGEAFVLEAVRSVFEQTHRNMELVAVDDGSPDRSVDLLRQFEQVKIVSQKNSGVAAARNTGIEHSTGEFVAFLDQDDWWLPDKVSLQLALFLDPKIGLVHTAVTHFDSAAGLEVPPLDPSYQPQMMVGDCFQNLLLGNPIYNSSVMVRRSVLTRVGGCDLSLAGNTVADYDLWLRIAMHFQLGFVDSPVTCYRMHPDQGMHDRRSMLEAELAVLLRIRDESTWRETPAGMSRLAKLYDDLAVAWYDQGESGKARQYFRRALRESKSGRSLVRWAVSWLPRRIVSRLRSQSAAGVG